MLPSWCTPPAHQSSVTSPQHELSPKVVVERYKTNSLSVCCGYILAANSHIQPGLLVAATPFEFSSQRQLRSLLAMIRL